MTDSVDESDEIRETTESIMKGVKKASDNVAHATKTADRHRRRYDLNPDPNRSKGSNPVMVSVPFPPPIDAASQNERRELIRENRDLHMRLKRAETAIQGLQRGYEEINERKREVTQDLKLREIELADCREILKIQTGNLDARSNELLKFKKRSTESHRGLELEKR